MNANFTPAIEEFPLSSKYSDEEIDEMERNRRRYIDRMEEKHLKSLQKGIMKNISYDFNLRDVRNQHNPDRLQDMTKIQ